jgi:predicted nucleotidyltransferase
MTKPAKGRTQLSWEEGLLDYVIKLVKISRRRVKFVVLDGSAAEKKDKKGSDYDVVVVKTGRDARWSRPIEFCGVFRRRVVSGWLMDEHLFQTDYIGGDDESFVWRHKQIAKARLLYGDRLAFNSTARNALLRRWTPKRQSRVVKTAFLNIVEYFGKALNSMSEYDSPEFYLATYVVAHNTALLVAGINMIDIGSENVMYRDVLLSAAVKPPRFEDDFRVASGFGEGQRTREATYQAARRLARWARAQTLRLVGTNLAFDPGFVSIVRTIGYI